MFYTSSFLLLKIEIIENGIKSVAKILACSTSENNAVYINTPNNKTLNKFCFTYSPNKDLSLAFLLYCLMFLDYNKISYQFV